MDREKQDEIAKLQLGWIDGICLPLYKVLVMQIGFGNFKQMSLNVYIINHLNFIIENE